MKKKLALVAGTAALALALGACAPASSDGGAASAEPAVLTIGRGNDIQTVDPHRAINASEAVLVNIYEYLVEREFDGSAVPTYSPQLATAWEQIDPLHWRFTLRDDVVFHDGEEFTADDVKFSIERAKSDATLSAYTKYADIVDIVVEDPYTIVFETTRDDPQFLQTFVDNGAGILPKDAFEAAGSAEAFFENPIGTGPYEYVSWEKGDRLTLAKNEDWWNGEPKWDEVVVRAISETTTRVAELLTGGIDIAENVPPDENERIEANEDTGVVSVDIARLIEFHPRIVSDEPTNDERVREAFSLAIDRESIVENVLRGYGTATEGFVPPQVPGYLAELDEVTYDPERARELLEEAGYEEGELSITISTPNGRYLKDKEISEAVAGYLGEVGVTATVEVLDWTVFNDRKANGDIGELSLWGMGTRSDSSTIFTYLDGATAAANVQWQDAEFEALTEQAEAATSIEELLDLAADGQRIFADAHVRIPIAYIKSNWGVNDRIEFAPRFDDLVLAEDVTLR